MMLNPANCARRLVGLHKEIGRPPIWRHDLCRRAATLTHAAGADLKDIKEMLGHRHGASRSGVRAG
ncbi:hypothetical protein [Streptomyces chartreusis]|uniref:hypothetical protein n=1 Tax=Streptomyces chartreusis TaxID=1969 RepID=UPI0035E1A5FB